MISVFSFYFFLDFLFLKVQISFYSSFKNIYGFHGKELIKQYISANRKEKFKGHNLKSWGKEKEDFNDRKEEKTKDCLRCLKVYEGR